MKLRDVSFALKAVGEIARTGERLLDSFGASRRSTGWPVLLGIGMGVGIGALIFSDEARDLARDWFDQLKPPPERKADGEPRAQVVARPS